jgi:endonuclease YncB( thermonuclease family)
MHENQSRNGRERRCLLPSTDCAGGTVSEVRSALPQFPLRLPAVATAALLALPAVAVGLAAACQAQGLRVTVLSAMVLSVGDGDTLRVRLGAGRRTVRLACVDAPELSQRPDGPRAREALRQLAPGGAPVRLVVKATDRYGRLVAEVFTSTNLNLALLAQGAVFVYPQSLKQCDAPAYRAAEQQASRSRLGVWRQPGGIARPWLVRRQGGQR